MSDQSLSFAAWAVVATQPNREDLAVRNLKRQGFTVYAPQIQRRVRHARRTQDVLRPLFPGYLFVRIDDTERRWQAINSTLGVRSIVRFGNQVGSVDARFIESLKTRESDGYIVNPIVPFTVGQSVQLVNGPFEGLVAQIIAVDEKERLVLLMDFLNRGVRIRVDGHNVTPA